MLVVAVLAVLLLGDVSAETLAAVLLGSAAAVVLAAFAVPALAISGVLFIVLHRVRRSRRVPDGYGPPVARIPVPRPPADPVARWRSARRRFDVLRGEYASYECDPLAVLRLPALADVTVPATGRFVDAFANAQALDTEAPPPPEHGEAFVRAVDYAWRCWRAAQDAADRIRLSGLTAEERSSVQRTITLLLMARDSGHEAERLAAYTRARTELAKLEQAGRLRVPRPAMAKLDEAARLRLPPVAEAG
ncbi:MAG TPA: hypothetical protein VGH99_06420 [Pseudonocardia sp.]